MSEGWLWQVREFDFPSHLRFAGRGVTRCGSSRQTHSEARALTMADADDDRHTSMQFCQECNNLMYPREVKDDEDQQNSRLVYVCKAPNCVMSSRSREECADAESQMVWKHVVQHTMRADDIINADITQDPTLPKTSGVTCKNPEVVAPPLMPLAAHAAIALPAC